MTMAILAQGLAVSPASRNRPNTPRSPRSVPAPALFPCTAANSRDRPPETQKGGRISPAAKRFPPSPFREAVKPPLVVPVLRDRLLGELCDGQPIGFDPGEDRPVNGVFSYCFESSLSETSVALSDKEILSASRQCSTISASVTVSISKLRHSSTGK